MNKPWAAVLAHVVLASCSPTEVPPPNPLVVQPVSPPAEKPTEQRAIVWTKGDGESARSHWIGSSLSRFRVVEERDGIFVAAENGTWSVRTERVEVATEPCDPNEGPSDAPAGEGVAHRLVAELVGGQERQVLVEPETEPGANEVMHGVSVLASVGPYLFVKEHEYMYACGAHGGSSAKLIVWDLRRQAPAELADERVSNQMVDEARTAMLEPDDPAGESPVLTFVGVVPRYDAGKLVSGYLYTTFACYACGGGEWGSYTQHAIVAGPVPGTLVPYLETPDVVRAFAGSVENEMGGWSVVESRQR